MQHKRKRRRRRRRKRGKVHTQFHSKTLKGRDYLAIKWI
jgi:hypothetical protein